MNSVEPEPADHAGTPDRRPASALEDPYGSSRLTTPQRSAWATLIAVTVALDAQMEAALHREAGLTPFEFHLLYMLGAGDAAGVEGGGEMPMSRAALLLNASLSRLSHVVRRLEDRGWLERRLSPEDARVTLVRVTEEGHGRLLVGMPVYERLIRRLMVDRMGEEDLREFTRLGVILLGGLKEDHWVAAAVSDEEGDDDGGPEAGS